MDQYRAWRTVADCYHGFFVGLVLRTVVQRGADDAAKLVFRTFRTQHLNRFLPGLAKLGLTGLPHAVAAAQYHYLSNRIGGVVVEFMPESDQKAWVRFPPPRWAWRDVAICGIPTQVSEAMLRGWQAHNGVSLGNPRLGFVCTKMAVDGDAGLEGYFQEYDHDLAPEDRLRFARNEEAPPFDPALAPTLDWPAERLAKAHRGYAMEYVRSALPVCVDLFGAETARFLAGGAGRLVGMQLYAKTAAGLGIIPDGSPETFGMFLAALAEAQGDEIEVTTWQGGVAAEQEGWRLMADNPDHHPVVLDCWAALLDGALAAHNHRLSIRRDGLRWWIG
jgi:hypothetical protein